MAQQGAASLEQAAAGGEPSPPPRAPVAWRSAHSAARGSALRSTASSMIHFVLLISRQGKVRLTKWYSPYSSKEKARTVREVSAVVLSRQQKQCNFLEYKDKKVIYKRCASAWYLAWPTHEPATGGGGGGRRPVGAGGSVKPGGASAHRREAGWSLRAQASLTQATPRRTPGTPLSTFWRAWMRTTMS